MICDTLTPELAAYHLGALDFEARAAIDDHLLECRSCLKQYLATKRSLEDGPVLDEAPSELTRARVRADVARMVTTPSRVQRMRPAWFALGAAAAAALFLFAFELGAGRLRHETPPPAPSPLIDTQQAQVSLTVL